MTGIVERLRDWAAQMRVGETNLIAAHLVPHDLLEAADEIERLRKDNIAIVLSAQANDEQNTQLFREIERLRTILEKIATLRHSNSSAASIAQSALDTMKALKE